MRVYNSGRTLGKTIRTDSGYVWLGIPVEGEWVDAPDYFNQVTRGQPINDVVHAKVVDQFSGNLLMADHLVDGRYPWKQVTYDGPREYGGPTWWLQVWCSFPSYSLSETVKHRPGRRDLVINTRTLEPYCLYLWAQLRPDNRNFFGGFTVQVWTPTSAGSDTVRTVKFTLKSERMSANPASYRFSWENNISSGAPIVGIELPTDFARFVRNGRTEQEAVADVWSMVDMVYRYFRSLPTARVVDCVRANPGTVERWSFKGTIPNQLPNLPFREYFLFDEDKIIGEGVDPILLGAQGGLKGYWRNSLTQHALLSACDNLPRFNENSISNLLEIVGFIKTLVVDRKIEIPKSLADLWLSYRYQFMTTVADAKEAINFVDRYIDLGGLDRMIVSRGSETIDYQGTRVTCRCSVEVRPKYLDTLGRIWRTLTTYGLSPNFYVVWDMIPYSFMVDWFLPISDLAKTLDTEATILNGEWYEFTGLSYSLTYQRQVDGYPCKFYTRWAGSVPSGLNGLYWLQPPSAGKKTWGKRVLDAASIFIGR